MFKIKKRLVSAILLLTLILWLTGNLHGIPASIVSFLPIILLTMFGIVSGEEVRKLPWDTLMLVAGGLSLGLAIKETGLADYYVSLLKGFDINFYVMMILFSVMTVTFSNFMSNTATATILIPIAIILASQNALILPLVISLSASAALFLPISTPPNAIAFSTGRIDQKDFMSGGFVAAILAPIVIIIGVMTFINLYY